MPEINPQRLLSDLRKLRSFGASGNGVVRCTYSEIDLKSRYWLREKMNEAGLAAEIDGIGNVIGRSPNPGTCLLLGSHSDTQPSGGWLDGALGVIYALEVARSLLQDPATAAYAVDVVSWADEEASFLGMAGSRSFCGLLEQGDIDAAVGRDGRTLVQALKDCGLERVPRRQYEVDRHGAYIEAHIEQGPTLESGHYRIGVVTSIVGMRDFLISFVGQQNHAGTTPMALRKDAGMALIGFADRLNKAVRKIAAASTVWTIGKVEFSPGAPSIIPGRASMNWQFRDPDEARVRALHQLSEKMVAEFNSGSDIQASIRLRDDSAQAAKMDAGLQALLCEAAEKNCPGKWLTMPSGAAHDAQTLAQRMPAGMLFIPSIKGISHSFDEDSHEQDIILGCQVMADAVASWFRR